MQIALFRIFYSTTFSALFILLFALLLLTPADAVYQVYKSHQLLNIGVIAGAYLLTLFLATLIYASRIYTNRSVLAGIPKACIPVENGDVGKGVRKLVAEGLARSAIIAYEARPRDVSEEEEDALDHRLSPPLHSDHHQHTTAKRKEPTWGPISHPGWSSPSSPDLPYLQYESVIHELPNLIEAKAVSLAPADPLQTPLPVLNYPYNSNTTAESSATPDPRVVEILQRPAMTGLRDYIAHLTTLNLINPPNLGNEFLALYERARFSSHALDETCFRSLMGIFAEILRGMSLLDPEILAEVQNEDFDVGSWSSISDEKGDADTVYTGDEGKDEAFQDTRSRSRPIRTSRSSSSSGASRSIRTAPLIQRRSTFGISQTRTPPATMVPRTPSTNSLRLVRSNMSRSSGRSGGSVIRLAEARGPLDLPYTIDLPGRG